MTPKFILKIVFTLLGFNIFLALIDPVFSFLPTATTWTKLLSLSHWGITHGFIWQLITYPLLYSPGQPVDFLFLLSIGLNLFFFARIASIIYYAKSKKQLIILIIGATLAAGIAATISQNILINGYFYGFTPILHALFIASAFLYPRASTILLFNLQIKIKNIIAVILVASLITDLSNSLYTIFYANITSILFGYFFALLSWKSHSPYISLMGFETSLLKLTDQLRSLFKKKDSSLSSYARKARRYDFKTGDLILEDEDFVNACLSKISENGYKSLTFFQKIKLRRVSRRIKKEQRD